jgi:hypothetical protein
MMSVIAIRVKIIFVFFFSLAAQSQVADLEVTIDLPDFQEVKFSQVVDFNITITNFGPDSVGNGDPLNYSHFLEFTKQQLNGDQQLDLQLFHHPAVDPLCSLYLRVEDSPNPNIKNYIYELHFPGLLAGESVVCFAQYAASFQQGFRSFTWQTESSLSESDPNLTNNAVDYSIGIFPRIIPSINFGGLLIAILVLYLIGLRRFIIKA